jgi:predicted nucleic acid-binding Zn finger protein
MLFGFVNELSDAAQTIQFRSWSSGFVGRNNHKVVNANWATSNKFVSNASVRGKHVNVQELYNAAEKGPYQLFVLSLLLIERTPMPASLPRDPPS